MAETKIINALRYSQGFTYEAYLAQLGATRQRFTEQEQAFQLASADALFFKNLVKKFGLIKVLAVGEDWCPDVHRGLPIIDSIAKAGGMELRIFPRDKNLDIMNLYLNQGKFMSIPVLAFFSEDFTPLCHWVERSAAATRAMEQFSAELSKEKLTEEEIRQARRQRSAPLINSWQQETVKELKELLSQATK